MRIPGLRALKTWRQAGHGIWRAPRGWSARAWSAVAVVAAAVIAAGVYLALPGHQSDGPTAFPVHTVAIYASLPLSGPERIAGRAILKGFQAGLDAKVAANGGERGRIGNYKINFIPLNDATSRGWSPRKVQSNALSAVRNPSTVLYVGDLDSGATEISLPILNQAGIAQIAPGGGYVGLTQAVSGVTKRPQLAAFYSSGKRTLLRLIPNDMVQAGAVLQTAKQYLGCQRVAALSQGSSVDGPALVRGIHKLAGAASYKLTFVPTKFGKRRGRAAINAYALSLKELDVGCFVLAGLRTRRTVELVSAIRAALPHVPIIATSGLCKRSFTDARRGGVPAAVAGDDVYCMSPVLPLKAVSHLGGTDVQEFVYDYRQHFPGAGKPSPYAVNGFVAAEMAVEAVAVLGEGADRRASVLGSVFQGVQSLPLGYIAFDRLGNSSLLTYGLYRIGPNGTSEFVRTIDVDGAT